MHVVAVFTQPGFEPVRAEPRARRGVSTYDQCDSGPFARLVGTARKRDEQCCGDEGPVNTPSDVHPSIPYFHASVALPMA